MLRGVRLEVSSPATSVYRSNTRISTSCKNSLGFSVPLEVSKRGIQKTDRQSKYITAELQTHV